MLTSAFVLLFAAPPAAAAPKGGHASDAAAAPASGPHWEYDGEHGQAHWGELAPQCDQGREQSPIDLSTAGAVGIGLDDVMFHYHAVSGEVVNNGHTIQVNVEGGDSIDLDGVRYDLAQFHLHTPSEHRIDSKEFPAELHLVHKDASGNLAVIGLLLEVGERSPALDELFASMPKAGQPAKPLPHMVDLGEILPGNHATMRYHGSLTTPPCSEGVNWVVFRDPISVTAAQLASFKKLFDHNAREVQPVNGRATLLDRSY